MPRAIGTPEFETRYKEQQRLAYNARQRKYYAAHPERKKKSNLTQFARRKGKSVQYYLQFRGFMLCTFAGQAYRRATLIMPGQFPGTTRLTSPVVRYTERTGLIETENTLYYPLSSRT